ncbi:MAG: DEAD/DEAH box helicase, partial [Desulfovibrio sp.]|nr:DEAD/DEAH box helicase [Desulfovibrio sp.]
VYGGVGYKGQTTALQEGATLVVGTPGRILDHILRKTLDLSKISELILDEADRMLSIGFYPDMKEIQTYLPKENLHTTLLSATYPPHVLNLASEFMSTPDLLSLSHKEVHVAEVRHCFCQVKPLEKDRALIRLIEAENPSRALIFCNTRANVTYLTKVLQGFGYNAEGLSSDLSQSKREEVLEKIKLGQLNYLVATDLASRGLDIQDLSHVFLYEPPEDHESYIHRAGRTGRCGSAGTVISLTDVMEQLELARIARHYHIALQEISVPTEQDIAKLVGDRLIALLEARYRSLQGLEKIRIERYLPLAQELCADTEEQSGLKLLAMLLDACHRANLEQMLWPKPASAQGKHHHGRRHRKKAKSKPKEESAATENS